MTGVTQPTEWDVFVCHASEDKTAFVDPLVAVLKARALRVWYDAAEIEAGDDFRRGMEEGIRTSRLGVVIISPNFSRYWTEAELSALFAQEAATGTHRILPILLNLTFEDLAFRWPLLSGRAVVAASDGVGAVAQAISDLLTGGAMPARRNQRSVVYGAPRRGSTAFLGRTAKLLETRERLIAPATTAPGAVSLEGLAGIGKTELAVQLVRRLDAAGSFRGGIYWLDAEDPDLITQWGTTIAGQMGSIRPGPVDERAQAVVAQLSQSPEPVLVVLDNVEAWTTDETPHPLPQGSHARLLVTTRVRFLGGAAFEHIDLDTLESPDDRSLLEAVAGRSLADADALLAHLGGHALALELAGVHLRRFGTQSTSAYLANLQTHPSVPARSAAQVAYARTLDESLHAAWVALDLDARQDWLRAASFENDPVTVELAAGCGLDEEGLADLADGHLVRFSDDGRWTMHRLVRDYARRFGAHEATHKARAELLAGLVARAATMDGLTGYEVYAPDKPHFDAGIEVDREAFSDGRAYSDLLSGVAHAHKSLGAFGRCRVLLEKALASDLELFGEDSDVVAERRSDLASVLNTLGDLSGAQSLISLALAAGIRTRGEAHPDVATRRSKLALVLRQLGDLEGAKLQLEAALESDLATVGDTHPSVAVRRSNLALVLQDMGDSEAARCLLEQALASDLDTFGETHPKVAVRRSNLASVLRDLDDLAGARDLLRLAIDAGLGSIDESHPSIALRRWKLASVQRALGQLEDAKALLELSLTADLEAFGPDHRRVAQRRADLALVLADLGRLVEARSEAREAIRAARLQPEGAHVRTRVEADLTDLIRPSSS